MNERECTVNSKYTREKSLATIATVTNGYHYCWVQIQMLQGMIPTLVDISQINKLYRKSGNFHVKIICVLNIHTNLFSWVYGTHQNILT